MGITRRALLASPALLAAQSPPPKRIAAVITEYRELSHADVVVGKYLEGFRHDGKPPYPRSKIVSMSTEQVPKNDLSREKARNAGVPIFRTVRDALTLGGDKLAVDGVLVIGEHGDYPLNDNGQKLYPRFELFLKVTDVFRESGRSVPVYTDKALSWDWGQAKRMYAISKELRFPVMAGSSIPVALRSPLADTPFGSVMRRAAVISFGGLEGYGFHGIEGLQCMLDRRRGGETGVRAVQCLSDAACWRYMDENGWARALFDRALAHSETRVAGDPRALVKRPAVFVIDYNDGAVGCVFQMNGLVQDWTGAADVEGGAPFDVLFRLQRFGTRHHFQCLIQNIEKMFETGQPPYPVERVLLSGGMLDFLLDSHAAGGKRIETPELARIRYQTPNASHYCTQGWETA